MLVNYVQYHLKITIRIKMHELTVHQASVWIINGQPSNSKKLMVLCSVDIYFYLRRCINFAAWPLMKMPDKGFCQLEKKRVKLSKRRSCLIYDDKMVGRIIVIIIIVSNFPIWQIGQAEYGRRNHWVKQAPVLGTWGTSSV